MDERNEKRTHTKWLHSLQSGIFAGNSIEFHRAMWDHKCNSIHAFFRRKKKQLKIHRERKSERERAREKEIERKR